MSRSRIEVDPVDLPRLAGAVYGPSGWLAVDQNRVDSFADATGDHQWIHVDPERARRSPLGGTIAHGNLTLALITPMFETVVVVGPCERIVNYGYDRIRFLAPVWVGSGIRATAELMRAQSRQSAVLCSWRFTVESDCRPGPALVAENFNSL